MARTPLRLEDIDQLDITAARVWWSHLYHASAPSIALPLLRMGLAYRLQSQIRGLTRRTSQSFAIMPQKAMGRKLTPGTRLVRDWHGVGHIITVVEDGFEYDGQRWTSLTAIAKAITGAKWSGPRFFGLQK